MCLCQCVYQRGGWWQWSTPPTPSRPLSRTEPLYWTAAAFPWRQTVPELCSASASTPVGLLSPWEKLCSLFTGNNDENPPGLCSDLLLMFPQTEGSFLVYENQISASQDWVDPVIHRDALYRWGHCTGLSLSLSQTSDETHVFSLLDWQSSVATLRTTLLLSLYDILCTSHPGRQLHKHTGKLQTQVCVCWCHARNAATKNLTRIVV